MGSRFQGQVCVVTGGNGRSRRRRQKTTNPHVAPLSGIAHVCLHPFPRFARWLAQMGGPNRKDYARYNEFENTD